MNRTVPMRLPKAVQKLAEQKTADDKTPVMPAKLPPHRPAVQIPNAALKANTNPSAEDGISKTAIRPAVAALSRAQRFAEELAIFTAAMTKEPSPLLDCLSEELAASAKQRAEALRAGTSADRQGTLAKTFGARSDAANRVRQVVTEAGPALRLEISRQLPLWLRAQVEDLVPANLNSAAPPMVVLLAERLIREATR